MVIIATVMIIITVDYLLSLIEAGPGCKNSRMFLLPCLHVSSEDG